MADQYEQLPFLHHVQMRKLMGRRRIRLINLYKKSKVDGPPDGKIRPVF